MAVPTIQAGAEQAWLYTALPKTVTLSGDATNTPILEWEWRMLYVPPGSTAAVGVNGNFLNGVAKIQNPSFVCDIVGCYVLQLKARNVDGWSDPLVDQEDGQTPVYILTEKYSIRLPGAFLWRYDGDLNRTLTDLEAAIGGSSLDSTALHKATGGEISLMAEKSPAIGNDLLLIEDSVAGYAKKKIKISSLPSTVDVTALHKVTEGEIYAMTEKTTPVSDDIVVIEDSAAAYAKKKVKVVNLLPVGSDRWLTYKQDTEYTESGTSFVNKFAFRVVRDSNKPPIAWRAVVSMWSTNLYGGRAEVRVRVVGSGGTDSVTIYSDVGTTENPYAVTLAISPAKEPQDEVIDVYVDLRIDTSMDTAYMKFFEFFSIIDVGGGGGGGG